MARTHRGDSIPLQSNGYGAPARRGNGARPKGRARAPRPSVPNLMPLGASPNVADPYATDPRLRAMPRERVGFAAVLRNKYFLRLWMAQLISQTIMNATNYALITLIARESKSLVSTALAIVAFALPALLFGAPAGVAVDRFDRRKVLWMSNALRIVATLAFVVSLAINSSALVPIYALAFLIAIIGQFFSPAEGAAIPRLVKPREVINALALFNITFTISQAAGLIIVGPLVLLLVPTFSLGLLGYSVMVAPVESLLVLVAALYFVCVLLILSIPARRLEAPDPAESAARLAIIKTQGTQLRSMMIGIREALTFIGRDLRLSVVVFQLALSGVVTSVIAMVAPTFVGVYFDKPPEAAALVFVPAGIGLVIGAAFTPNITRRLGHGRTVLIGVATLALATSLITGAHLLESYLATHDVGGRHISLTLPLQGAILLLTFLMGIALDFINVPAQATLQELSPDYIKGRVLAVQIMFFNAITIPVVLVLGKIGDTLGLDFAMNVLAVAVLVVGVISVLLWGLAEQAHAHGAWGAARRR